MQASHREIQDDPNQIQNLPSVHKTMFKRVAGTSMANGFGLKAEEKTFERHTSFGAAATRPSTTLDRKESEQELHRVASDSGDNLHNAQSAAVLGGTKLGFNNRLGDSLSNVKSTVSLGVRTSAYD
jgi:hypothetical protein